MTYDEAMECKEDLGDSYSDERGNLYVNFILPSLSSDRAKYIAQLKGIKYSTPPDVRDYATNDDYSVEGLRYEFIFPR